MSGSGIFSLALFGKTVSMRSVLTTIALSSLIIAPVAMMAGCNSETAVVEMDDETTITPDAFEATVNQDQLVLVKFGAPWCGPCRMIDEELPKLAGGMGSDLEILRINVDNNPDLASEYGATSIPKMVLFRNGSVVSDRVGYMSAGELESWISNVQ